MTEPAGRGLRIDRWLWYARFFKSRNLATAAVNGGHVKINDERAKPGNRVTPGDHVHLVRDQLEYELVVSKLPLRRGPAAEARECYSESDESRNAREARIDSLRQDRRLMPRTEGRPDKHTRRKVRQFNRKQADD
ncbi:MAG: RNA-binding S4 domain-containing protein [Gammaproteobacteria bacterium]|nr:RNA-binding S4 domain-containing protein [Gammaproteobacteria bacterium]MDH4315523.1 RNA-binding S4 domain-containing protein [Gammaproteobacteria bacterium]MDH5214308.1 RNA-binding S4 domain-containing protein [Gammaproteobacteria bacterium]MDH5501424.1 RNA-binding S4 domain-containing protein [Gammaproteobacteria bacterium]